MNFGDIAKLAAGMRILCLGVLLLEASASAVPLPGTVARLALVSNSDDAASAADVLTAQLSGNPQVQLLERDQIAKVYQEQGLSAGNTDYLKLGQVLGADGLMLLDVTKEGTNQTLNVRLVAVKPGVVLLAERLEWPLKDAAGWAAALAGHLPEYLPKLTVLTQDAIPLSVVNLRSAIASADGSETERELKLLTIQRLSQEPQLFVLERQKMALLGGEKDLKLDDSPFWNGAWLLDGVIDQNGYSKDTVTVNARLTPKSGAPLLLEASGSRTNLAEVINQLTAKVTAALKISPTAREWNAADEAAKYYDEAQWALRWGVYAEAESAADSAWALGMKQADCAALRINSCLAGLNTSLGKYQHAEYTISAGFDENGKPVGPPPGDAAVKAMINNELSSEPPGASYRIYHADSVSTAAGSFSWLDHPPDPSNLARALRLLELYAGYARNHPDGVPMAGTQTNGWKNSDWYDLGLNVLAASARVLQNFNSVPESQAAVMDKLADLRATTRSLADWIAAIPSVHDSYFTGNRRVTHDELANTLEESPNLFKCEATWGCFWQERPEDTLAMYRQLLGSPAFRYIHSSLWIRDVEAPRLTAWNDEDRRSLAGKWDGFVRELAASTNVFLQLEARALTAADADHDGILTNNFIILLDNLLTNRDALVSCPVDVAYNDWGVTTLLSAKSNGGSSSVMESIGDLFRSRYASKLDAMESDYFNYRAPDESTESDFDRQKQFLESDKPFAISEFMTVFMSREYSLAQARELLPLVAAYKTNLAAQLHDATGIQKMRLRSGVFQIAALEDGIRLQLNPPVPQSMPAPAPTPAPVISATAPPQTPAPPAAVTPPQSDPPDTNAIPVTRFLPIPLDSLASLDHSEQIDTQYTRITATAHHWLENRLVLDFHYELVIDGPGSNGNLTQINSVSGSAVAMLDPAAGHWEVVALPDAGVAITPGAFYHRTTLWHGELLTSYQGKILNYDRAAREWRNLAIPETGDCELFVVNEHLYAANGSMILELLDENGHTRLLASMRRRPAASSLDSEDFGTPVLFEGPEHSLRVATGHKVFVQTATDWTEVCPTPPASFPPMAAEDGLLFRTDGFNAPATISRLAAGASAAELCFRIARPPQGYFPLALQEKGQPLWELPETWSPAGLPAALRRSDVYLLVDHAAAEAIDSPGKKSPARDDHEAALLCFVPGLSSPAEVTLRFDNPDGSPPLSGIDPADRMAPPQCPPVWLQFAGNYLFCGLEQAANFIPNLTSAANMGSKPGVWMLPVDRIDAELETRKAALTAGQQQNEAAKFAAKELVRKNLLTRYDLNHNGKIDPEEQEAALDDPAYIGLELDEIDTNHDGWLEGTELAWFDANHNRQLDSKELAGIDQTIHLLAGRLLRKFNQSGGGGLNWQEYDDMMKTTLHLDPVQTLNLRFESADTDHNSRIDHYELERLLKRYAELTLDPQYRPGMSSPLAGRMFGLSRPFKDAVESAWQNPGGGQIPQPPRPPGAIPP